MSRECRYIASGHTPERPFLDARSGAKVTQPITCLFFALALLIVFGLLAYLYRGRLLARLVASAAPPVQPVQIPPPPPIDPRMIDDLLPADSIHAIDHPLF